MPRFEPFPALRYALDRVHLAAVAAPPYDVIDPAQRARLAARSPYNAVHVDCPVGDADCYQEAATTFRRWREAGVLVADPEPTLTVYRMSFTDEAGRDRHTTGVLGALGLEAPGQGDVLPHEQTTPKARSDRLDLLRATEANLSPIWVLSMASDLTKLLDPAGPAAGGLVDDDGVRHEVWPLADPAAIDAVCEVVRSAPVVIADGHHRYETCLAYAAERPDLPGAAATLALAVELVDEELTVGPIHRLIGGLPPGFDLLEGLRPWFDVEEGGRPDAGVAARMLDADAMALVQPDSAWLLRPRDDRLAGAGGLDTRRLDIALEGFPPHDLTFQHGTAEVIDAVVATGRAQAAVLLRPVAVEQIAATANAGERFPPKTTFFWPKPRSGLLYRPLT